MTDWIVWSEFVTMLFKHFSQSQVDTRLTFKAKSISVWKSTNCLGLWLSFTFYLEFSHTHNLYNSHTGELLYFRCLCEETECTTRVWMLSSLWFYIFTLMNKLLKLSVRNVRDANTLTLELFVPVNDTVTPVSSKVKHLQMNLTFFFIIVQ